jgi:hypothetical protein
VKNELTLDDALIWEHWVGWRGSGIFGWAQSLRDTAAYQDRRDAMLMFRAQLERRYGEIGWVPVMAPANIDPYPHAGGVRLGRRGEWLAQVDLDREYE